MSEDIVGSLVTKVGYDTTGLRKGEVEAERSLKRVDESMEITGKGAHKLSGHLGTVGTALGALAGFKLARELLGGLEDSISKASDLNETLGKTKVVFGDAFDQVDRFAQGSAKSIGLSRQAAEEAAATYGNLFVSMGVGKSAAADMSVSLVQLAGDLASFNNTSQSDALEALKSGLVGEVEPLRRYGVAIDDTTLRQKALELGLVDTTKNALAPAVRTQAAYALILDKTKTAQGDFARTADGQANSLRKLQADSANAKAELGQGLLPVQLGLIKAADDLLPALTGVAQAVGAIGGNPDARHTIEVVGGVAAGLYALNKAIVLSKAVRDSEIATLLRGTAAREASTAAIVAESEAAAIATRSVGGLAVAEGAAGSAGAAGAAGRLGTRVGAGVGAIGVAGAFAAGGYFGGKLVKSQVGGGAGTILGDTVAGAGYGAAIGSVVPGVGTAIGAGVGAAGGAVYGITKVTDTHIDKLNDVSGNVLKMAKGPILDLARQLHDKPVDMLTAIAFVNGLPASLQGEASRILDRELTYQPSTVPRATGQGLAGARLGQTGSALESAIKATHDEKAIASEAGRVGNVFGGIFDDVAPTTQGNAGAAQDKLTSANDRVASAQDRVAESTRHLNALRATGKATTGQLADAEDRLAAARRNLDSATRTQSGRQADLTKAQASTALSAQDLLGRLTGQAGHAEGLATANDKLAKSGLARPVIEQIDALEKTAPGTIARVAASLTPAMVKHLDSEYYKLQKAEHEFLTAPLRAAEAAAKRENERAAAAYAAAYRQALEKSFADLDVPLPVGLRPGAGGAPAGAVGRGAPATSEGQAFSKQTTYNLPNAVIVASSPVELARQLEARTRAAGAGGGE